MKYVVATLFGYYWNVSGDYLLLFFLSAFGFSMFGELIKKSLYPKLTKAEAEKNVQTNCPKWVGLLMGIAWTLIFSITAIIADRAGAERCAIVGGLYFFPITMILYFSYQWAVMLLVKKLMKAALPRFMTGEASEKKEKKEAEVVIIPKGTKVKRVSPDELD